MHAKNEVKEWMGLDPELAKLLGVPATWIRGEKKKGDKYKIVRLRLRAGLLEKQKSEATNITFQALWIKRQQQPGTPPPHAHKPKFLGKRVRTHKNAGGGGGGLVLGGVWSLGGGGGLGVGGMRHAVTWGKCLSNAGVEMSTTSWHKCSAYSFL